MSDFASEVRDGMRIDWDVPIPMDDGVVLRADVYRPPATGRFPVILTYGPYGKGLHFEDLYSDQWRRMVGPHPEVMAGSTCKYQNWEVVDPEKWVPDGYACVRVDSRGAGRSPGLLDIWSARETPGLPRLRRVGGGTAVEQRQGRPERDLVLRDEPVAGGGPPAAAPRRDLHLGGRGRLLPGPQPPRRDPVHLRPGVVPLPGDHAPARPRDAGPPQPDDRGLGLGARDAHRGGAGGDAARLLRGLPPPPARHRRVLALAPARLLEDHGPAPVDGQLGRARVCTRAATSRASSGRRRPRSGSRCTASSTGRTSTPTTAWPSRSGSSATSSRARTPAGRASRRSCSRSATPASGSSSGMKASGRWPARGGRSST